MKSDTALRLRLMTIRMSIYRMSIYMSNCVLQHIEEGPHQPHTTAM